MLRNELKKKLGEKYRFKRGYRTIDKNIDRISEKTGTAFKEFALNKADVPLNKIKKVESEIKNIKEYMKKIGISL